MGAARGGLSAGRTRRLVRKACFVFTRLRPEPLSNVDDYFSLGGSRCNSLISEVRASQVETAGIHSGHQFSCFDQLRCYLQYFSMMLTVLAGEQRREREYARVACFAE